MMEFRYCDPLAQLIDDDDGYDSDNIHESCRKSSDYAICNLSFPSPPWSPCDSSSDNDAETQWQCRSEGSVIDCVPQQSELPVACECRICELPGGPLINDCMWSAGVAVPISSNVGAAVPSVTPTSTLGHMLDSEITSSCPKEEIDECSSDNADNRAVCARLAQYHQTGTALQSASSSLVKAAKSGVGNCSRQCWVSEESDDLLHSDEDSSDEVDVVSVTPSKFKDRKLRVLPATSSISEQVAALHNYSCQLAPNVSAVATNVSCSRVTLSAPSSPSRQQQLPKTSSTSNPASPASKRSLLLQKCSQIRQMRAARYSTVNSDSDECAGSVVAGIFRSSFGGGKRSLHNVLERRRRSCLKVHFHLLRDVVPSVAGNCRMSKVAILKAAHCHMVLLKKEGLLLQAELNQLRSLNQRWQRKLALLSQ